MADTKISAAGDAGVLIATDMVPLARSGNVNAFRATMSEVATYTSAAAPVQSVATRTGAVTLTHTDITDWAATLAPYAPLASPTFTGTPTLPTGTIGVTQTAGTSNTSLATTAFVGTALGSFAPLAAPVFTGDARAVTASYGDNDTSIATTAFVQSAVAPAANNVGRNLVTNGQFVVQQRGAGPWTVAGFTADRWSSGTSSDTISWSCISLADADRAAIGDETALTALQNAFTGNAAAGAYNQILQRIENVRRLSGKSVTLSFWAKAASGTPKIGINLLQSFGTGGSPSASGRILATGNAVTISTAWARYSTTMAVTSAAGKTFGTNGDDWSQLELWFSCGATNNAAAGNIGVQSGTIQLWGVQLEIGSVATALDAGGTPQAILAECQRFYVASWAAFFSYANAGSAYQATIYWPVQMRAAPTVNLSGVSQTNMTVSALGPFTGGATLGGTATATAYTGFQANVTASADL